MMANYHEKKIQFSFQKQMESWKIKVEVVLPAAEILWEELFLEK